MGSRQLMSFEVTVSDGQLSSFSCLKVRLIDVNEKPVISDLCPKLAKYRGCPHVNENSRDIKDCKICKIMNAYNVAILEQDSANGHIYTIESGNKGSAFKISRSADGNGAL